MHYGGALILTKSPTMEIKSRNVRDLNKKKIAIVNIQMIWERFHIKSPHTLRLCPRVGCPTKNREMLIFAVSVDFNTE